MKKDIKGAVNSNQRKWWNATREKRKEYLRQQVKYYAEYDGDNQNLHFYQSYDGVPMPARNPNWKHLGEVSKEFIDSWGEFGHVKIMKLKQGRRNDPITMADFKLIKA
jgi:hypothetical protein